MATIKLNEQTLAAIQPPSDAAQAYYWDTEVTGFGVVVGRTGIKTFVARARVDGKKVKTTIGVAGRVRDDGHQWTVKLARVRAREILGRMAGGTNPNSGRNQRRDVPTLREGLALHVGEMKDAGKRDRSIETIEYDVPRLMSAWLDRPLSDLTVETVQRIKEQQKKHKTQTNRLLAHISAIWNTTRRLRRSTFSGDNPVGRLGVQKFSLDPEQPRIEEEDMPEWLRRVEALSNPIRRDLQLTALFTGMRTENATKIRWESVDWERGGLFVPRSKTTPFTIPLSTTVMEILKRRRDQNEIVFEKYRGDRGWVFPALSDEEKVIAIAECKERRYDTVAPPWTKDGPKKGKYKATGDRVLYLPGFHTLRRTFLSVAHECGVTKLDQHLLSNHAFGGRDVHDDYVRQAFPHLRQLVDRIDAAVWSRLRPPANEAVA